ncbi:S41 family peptidase [Pedobacter sp.]|jgi:carboxyl-terminal processing protease|uniref:S41 family peptidase n=1 Tax=Pedobacter sp. TaxID=1411316 RepID=UPI002BA49FE5|nr:S41 family peptidase [Pedobacter sp.]HWW38109.1 S41 family peptidase [Pedobacter sp.]
MSKIVLLSLFMLTGFLGYSQMKNGGFESRNTAYPDSLAGWSFKGKPGFKMNLDNKIKFEGNFSLKVSGDKIDDGQFQSFSQEIAVEGSRVQRKLISCYIKTADVMAKIGVWCQVWDEKDKVIGFESFDTQHTVVHGTTDWKKYTLPITVLEGAKKLVVGGFLMGNGLVWFDDFHLEEAQTMSIQPSTEVVKYIDEFNGVIKKNSIYKDSLDWKRINRDIAALSNGLQTISDTRVLTDYMIRELRKVGDNHSFIQNKTQTQTSVTGASPEKPISKLLENGIGYIMVPGFSSAHYPSILEFATTIQNQIKKLDEENDIKGWIVDLRTNTGGNMHPMIAGLGPLLREGDLGYFISGERNREKRQRWYYKEGREGIEKGTNVRVNSYYKLKDSKNKIAVLIGNRTCSSGEMTAISFIGANNTRLFGEPSGGYVTSNSMFWLSDGATLLLATGFVSDTNKKIYWKRIIPDVMVKSDSDTDLILKAAEEWLH